MYRNFVLGGLVVAYLLSVAHARADHRIRVQYIVSKKSSDTHSFVMSGSECDAEISSVMDNGHSSLILRTGSMKCDSDISLKDQEKGMLYDHFSRILSFASARQTSRFKKLLDGNDRIEIRILDQNCIQETNRHKDCVVDSPVVAVKGADGKKSLIAVALPRQVKIRVNGASEKALEDFFDESGLEGSRFPSSLVATESALAVMPGSPLASAKTSELMTPKEPPQAAGPQVGHDDRNSSASQPSGADSVGPESAFP